MNFIINKEEYLKIKAEWIKPGRQHHDATDHIFYNVLRGFDLKRGFSPIQPSKLQSGQDPYQSFDSAKSTAAWNIRTDAAYTGETPERAARRATATAERIAMLSKKYGTEFTPELIAAMRELFK